MGELVDKDTEHLRLLTLFYYVNAGINALFSCFALMYVVMGAVLLASPTVFGAGGDGPPAIVGFIFTALGAVLLLLGLGFSACLALTGRFLAQRRHRLFCQVIAGINCLFLPYGTVLGVFTFMVLTRPSAQALFAGAPPPLPPALPE
ncbi:MAG TPA: hypothetical protein VN893_26120 [Bryobacteraceae bacterium]|nr:hypothetical protein [Bryobacteraceae bacterium]